VRVSVGDCVVPDACFPREVKDPATPRNNPCASIGGAFEAAGRRRAVDMTLPLSCIRRPMGD
jgi:hypothetical protein